MAQQQLSNEVNKPIDDHASDAIIVGGGLAGLAAAALLARAGQKVVLLEKARHAGGRAATQVEEGFHWNLGAHALYLGGAAELVLRALEAMPEGAKPPTAAALVERNGQLHALPGGMRSLLTTGALTLTERWEYLRFLRRVPKLSAADCQKESVQAWTARQLRTEGARRLWQTYVRLGSYANAPGLQSAGAALAQLQHAAKHGVIYVHGGWQTMIDRLRQVATRHGAQILTSHRAQRVQISSGQARGVLLADGTFLSARQVLLAVPPREAADLLPVEQQAVAESWRSRWLPARAACLDLGLRELPRPERQFALSMDEPLYYSLHSASARLAPQGRHLVQVMKYLPINDASDPATHRAQIMAWIDRIQPGWREQVVVQRYLPDMNACSAIDTAATAGLAGRPAVRVATLDGLYLAGDWVGDEAMLADASLASAERAASCMLEGSSLNADSSRAVAVATGE